MALSPGTRLGSHEIVAPLGAASGVGLQFRWEIFNVLNHVNFDVPNRTAFTPNFGRIFSALPARQMPVGVKVLF
jgi:hypothetical protein